MNHHRSQKELLKRTARLEKELAAKNHGLEIEAALEKVRVVAMKMNKPVDLLKVCKTLFKQFLLLGFGEIRNAMINIHNDADKSFVNYDYSDEIGESTNHLTYKIHPLVEKQVKKIRSANDAFSETYFTGKDLAEWKKIRKRIGEKDDPRLRKSKELYYYFYSIGTGAIGISTFGAISKEKKAVLKRFRNVFNLCYQRHVDIAKAEAQAREAQTEAALEKVRSRSLAMHTSEELQTVINEIFVRLTELNVQADSASLMIFPDHAREFECWTASPASGYVRFIVPYVDYDFIKDLVDNNNKGVEIFTKNYTKEQKDAHFKYIFEKTALRTLSPERKKFIFNGPGHNVCVANCKTIAINVNRYSDPPFSEGDKNILARFAKVFYQCYTRFLDLQKAEAQAREAQIEAALERIRSTSLAMHHSGEIDKVANILFEKLKELGLVFDGGAAIILFTEGSRDANIGVVSPLNPPVFHDLPYDESFADNPLLMDLWKAKDEGIDIINKSYTFEQKNRYFEYVFKHNDETKLPGPVREFILKAKSYTATFIAEKNSLLGANSWTQQLFSEENIAVLRRVARVFEQAYIRFLDLQKAEAQAREAEIELGLERVRAKTMAMHKSNDLLDVIPVVAEQFELLGFKVHSVNINTDYRDKDWHLWIYNPGYALYTSQLHIAYFDHPFFNRTIESLENGSDFNAFVFTKEEKDSFLDYLYNNTIARNASEERKKFNYAGSGFAWSVVYLKNTGLTIANYDAEPYTEEQNAILRRFGQVFEQSYVRFLDLQKAESQAREAQIELGLERVRARAMAMQNSSELSELVAILFDELVKLDLVLARCIIWIFDAETLSAKVWMANSEDKRTADSYYIKRLDHPYYKAIIKAWKEKNPKWVYDLKGSNKRSIDDLLLNETELSKLPEAVKSGIRSSKQTIVSGSFNNFGFIEASGPVAHAEEQLDILNRFGKVFDLSYTRFNDLQKAEAQAREAQIELGLERVRARAMAMQNSEELNALIGTVFTELTRLDLVLTRCVILIYEGNEKGVRWWMANSETPSTPMNFFVKYADMPFFNEYFNGWRNRTLKWQYILEGENKVKTDDFLFKETELSQLPDFVIGGMRAPGLVYLNASFNNFGNLTLATLEPLSEEHSNILLRFAKVFDLTYTRFNDLKQAEAQATEAQIQLALERVRARTMAMQRSDELPEAANLLFQQIQSLGMPAWSAGYCIWDEDKNGITAWMSSEGVLQPPFHAPLTEDPLFMHMKEAYDRGETFFVDPMGGEDLEKHYQYMRTLPVVGKILDSIIEAGHPLPTFQIMHLAYFSSGFLLFITYEPVPVAHDIFKRFATVFDQTYTRFLDLKNAEAQGRESQIQLALERVRASTMAMHRSEDLAETAQILFHQLQELGGIPDRMSIGIVDETAGVVNFWSTDQLGSHINNSFKARLDERTVISKTYQAWKKNKKSLVIELHGEELKEWLHFAREEMNIAVKDEFIKDRRVHNLAFFSHGWLLVTTHETQPAEVIQILERFASVFNLTYRRFLDLQKAEAQAREAQIEAALERVRSRSMAMHQSNDLRDVVKVITEQLLALGLKFDAANFAKIDSEGSWDLWISTPEQVYPALVHVPYLDHGLFNKLIEVIKRGGDFLADAYDHQEKNIFFKHFFEHTVAKSLTPEARKQYAMNSRGFARSVFLTKNIWLAISNYDGIPFSHEENVILKRFANAFEQTYTRFLDLQKAEAQAREANIEAALERVRSRSLAMHKSDELSAIAKTMFEQLRNLGLELEDGLIIMLFREDSHDQLQWPVLEGLEMDTMFMVPYFDHPVMNEVYKARETGVKFIERHFDKPIKDNFLEKIFSITDYRVVPVEFQKKNFAGSCYHYSFAMEKFTGILMHSYNRESYPAEYNDILKRFARVFEQAYVRFLDLQRAEANAREAQIEAALERVRAKAMAMHSSQDLVDTIQVFYHELKSLSVTPRRCGVALMDKETKLAELTTMNTTEEGDSIEVVGQIKMYGHPVLDGVFENWLMQKEYHAVLRGNEIKEYYKVLRPQISIPDYPHDMVQYGYYFMFKEGDVYAWTDSELPEEQLKIYRRFASVISLTYKRYLDLKQAEAQAREAQIEAGLERVRARTMAMHTSDDVSAATATMFTELEKLGIENFRGGITNMLPNRTQHVWSVNNLAEGKVVKAVGTFNMDDHPFWQLIYKEWQEKNDFTHYFLAGQEKDDYVKILNATQGYLTRAIENFPDVHFQVYFFNEGGVWTNSMHAHTNDEQQIMKRFTSVFSLTFRRYQDLRKAEAQAREATIEAALEKVRGKAMAMHNSNDLSVTASMVFKELRKLGINPIRCGVGLLNKESRKAQLYSATSSAEGDSLSLVGWVILSEHSVLEKIYDTWLQNEEYYPQLQGEQMRLYYEQLLKGLPVTAPTIEADKKQYGHFIPFSVGCLYAWSEVAYNETEIKILKRFATIIDLTFRRYMELQHSEANAREAVKQAALDRIRADIASMRTVEDLDRITPLIWNELTILGIPFIRCGVFIMDDEQQLIHTFLSTPEGNAIAAFHMPYNSTDNLAELVSRWRNKETYISHWGEADMMEMADILVKQGAIATKEQYLSRLPTEGFHLHFLPFLQGMLYVANLEKLNYEQIELIEHVADAFSTAYSRYEDFNKLEAAKQQVERTLIDLKQAQTQLVQSEKMASLGELTAGIAHEIQNPLNFVNNFSDVSNELLEEMKEELAKGNINDAMVIAEDVRQNLEKINHHGKRADSIVKGMLQHSRTSTGQKEMTDINALADEYLRLAFHGLRAKDKSFNAKFETSFDDNVGKINIIQQDIGRVILNLINNAFYAVSEKKKHAPNARLPDGQSYEPTVTLTTTKENGKIELSVKDNGNGIAKNIVDKIFQPFFTTKPTGQGTGLGLSLAYDIVKAHGGEIKVKTEEGKGSEFIIQLRTD